MADRDFRLPGKRLSGKLRLEAAVNEAASGSQWALAAADAR